LWARDFGVGAKTGVTVGRAFVGCGLDRRVVFAGVVDPDRDAGDFVGAARFVRLVVSGRCDAGDWVGAVRAVVLGVGRRVLPDRLVRSISSAPPFWCWVWWVWTGGGGGCSPVTSTVTGPK
jgi:hypothetical protein